MQNSRDDNDDESVIVLLAGEILGQLDEEIIACMAIWEEAIENVKEPHHDLDEEYVKVIIETAPPVFKGNEDLAHDLWN